jgi:hypothetical protein
MSTLRWTARGGAAATSGSEAYSAEPQLKRREHPGIPPSPVLGGLLLAVHGRADSIRFYPLLPSIQALGAPSGKPSPCRTFPVSATSAATCLPQPRLRPLPHWRSMHLMRLHLHTAEGPAGLTHWRCMRPPHPSQGACILTGWAGSMPPTVPVPGLWTGRNDCCPHWAALCTAWSGAAPQAPDGGVEGDAELLRITAGCSQHTPACCSLKLIPAAVTQQYSGRRGACLAGMHLPWVFFSFLPSAATFSSVRWVGRTAPTLP